MSSKIRYCSECGKEISAQAVVCPNCGVQLKPLNFSSGKNKYVAAVLAFLLGGIGIQWFYLGRTLYGVLSILFCWTGVPAVISLIHFVILLISSEASFNEKYNKF